MNDNLMDIYSKPGTKVRYIAKNGYDSDVPNANEYLTAGEIYTVEVVDVGRSISYVNLQEVPRKYFNTVMFEKVNE